MKIHRLVLLSMIIRGLVLNVASEHLNYPIIWRKSRHDIATQVIQGDLIIHLESPCDILDQLKKSPKSNSTGLIAYYDHNHCRRSYVKQVIRPLRKYCPALSPKGKHMIRKRGVLSFAYSVIKIIFSITAVIGLFNFLQPQASSVQVPSMEQTRADLDFRIHQKLMTVMEKLQEEIEEVKEALESQQLATLLEIKFSDTERLINDMFDPENEHFANQLERLFPNISLGPDAPKRHWHLEGCQFEELDDSKYDNLHLKINGVKIDKEYLLLRADPFYIGITENKTLSTRIEEEVCLAEYIGPKFLAYHRRTGCAKEVLFDPINDHQTPFVFHSKSCKPRVKSIRDQWRKIRCQNRTEILPEEIVQIKMDNDHAYYYCFTQNRTVNDESIPCQNQIYQTKKNTNITINKHTIHVQKFRMEQFANLDPEITEALNDRIFNEDRSKVVEDLEYLVEKEHRLVTQIAISYVRYYTFWVVMLTITVALMLAIGYIYYQRHKSVKFREKRKEDIRHSLRMARVPTIRD